MSLETVKAGGTAAQMRRLVLGLAIAACSHGDNRLRPVASLSDTTAAATAFEPLRTRWARNEPSDRPALRQDLASFVERFPRDGVAKVARLDLALSFMDPPADWPKAERLLDAMAPPEPGAAHDLYLIAEAKVLRFHHHPDAAFELLRPIVGKVVDTRARALQQEELTFDALEARQPYEAIAYMDAWLRGSLEEDREASEAKVSVALGAVPEAALRGSLTAMRASTQQGQSHGYGIAIERLVAERLGQIAVARGDTALARWLLEPADTVVLGDEISAALGRLATSKRGIDNVVGRTVGLVLPTSSDALRDEAAEVLRGVLWAFEPQREGSTGGARLITRDDGGDASRLLSSLEEVAGEGASVIITALDAPAAEQALQWASSSKASVIVLARPQAPMPGFTVGEDWDAELHLLSTALAGSSLSPAAAGKPPAVATLADSEVLSRVLAAKMGWAASWQTPISCDVLPRNAGESRFPLDSWNQAGVRRWLVAGSSACATDLLRSLRGRSERGTVALSLEASDTLERAPAAVRLVTAAAGILPLTADGGDDARVLDVRKMTVRVGASPGWWGAVGHDAAVLALGAVAGLPADTTFEATEIARRRSMARRALLDVKAPLWTSEQESFDATGTLTRAVHLVELSR